MHSFLKILCIYIYIYIYIKHIYIYPIKYLYEPLLSFDSLSDNTIPINIYYVNTNWSLKIIFNNSHFSEISDFFSNFILWNEKKTVKETIVLLFLLCENFFRHFFSFSLSSSDIFRYLFLPYSLFFFFFR